MSDTIDGGKPDLVQVEIAGPEATYIIEASRKLNMSHKAFIKHALRLHQLHCHRLEAGETVNWSGDAERVRAFRGPVVD